ncbi:hypothetical protein J2Z50_004292 [Ensifer mexicanus]|nr:hypothetical protein [Sinorhizobium mexicanum]
MFETAALALVLMLSGIYWHGALSLRQRIPVAGFRARSWPRSRSR